MPSAVAIWVAKISQLWSGFLGDLGDCNRRVGVEETGSVGSGEFGVLVVNTLSALGAFGVSDSRVLIKICRHLVH